MAERGCDPLWDGPRKCVEIEGRVVLQDLVPNVEKLELAYVPIKGWIIDPDAHGPLDSCDDTVCLPTHYGGLSTLMQ